MVVLPSFPFWSESSATTLTDAGDANNEWSNDSTAADNTDNDGSLNVMTMKLVIAAAGVPVDAYYGFPMPQGTPFMDPAGGNKVRIATSAGRASVECWMNGN